jgi:phosphoglycolate phosphatase-like HAD superfamily hydrolase
MDDAFREWLEARRFRYCCFDFGGTLYDFQPVHVAAFQQACGVSAHSRRGRQIEDIVVRELEIGSDSVCMAEQIQRAFQIEGDSLALAAEKRRIVECLLDGALLSDATVKLVDFVAQNCRVAVVTRGMIESTRRILDRSLPAAVTQAIPVRGRLDFRSRPSKVELLSDALGALGARSTEACYVGDSTDDAQIASRLGVAFYHANLY